MEGRENKVTVDTITAYLEEQVENVNIIGPHVWIDAAQKINTLRGTEDDLLFILQQGIAKQRAGLIEEGSSVAKANALIEATDEYRKMQSQRAKIKRIEELIRISKLQARLKDNEMRGY